MLPRNERKTISEPVILAASEVRWGEEIDGYSRQATAGPLMRDINHESCFQENGRSFNQKIGAYSQ
jgi:hypothetical protein